MRYRHEYKYMIEARQEAILLVKTAGLIPRDIHVDSSGGYTIRSLYFDDRYDSCLKDNLYGADPRSKYRIRYYGHDLSHISLEKKTKYRMMTLKETCLITKEECEIFLKGEVPILDVDDSEIKKKLFTEVQTKGLIPKTIVTYHRVPFVYPGGNVRITFDQRLSSSHEVDKFLEGNYMTRPVFPLGQSLMEVKWDEVLPKHIKEVLKLEDLRWTAFSKYYMCRTIHL